MRCLVSEQAQAGSIFLTGNDLVKVMREDDNANVHSPNTSYYDVGIYSGFVVGVYDTSSVLNMICPSTSVTRGQAKAIVAKYLKLNPEKWEDSAVNLVFTALVNAFPCKK